MEMQDSSLESGKKDSDQKIVRLITACLRCRQRKVKCDREFPSCGNCRKSGAKCVVLDPQSGEVVSRMSIFTLKQQLDQVTKELEDLKRLRALETAQTRPVSENSELLLLAQVSQEFRFGRVLLMSNNEIQAATSGDCPLKLPEKLFAEACIQSFFAVTNIQVPILHRDSYLFHFFKPLYGTVGGSLLSKIFGDNFNPSDYKEELEEATPLDEAQKGKCLFFLYIIIAILTSQHQQHYPLAISTHYKNLAFRYVDLVWRHEESDQDELAKLEMLQSLLLLTQYALMRPCSPGAWYLVGTTVRLCQDLGLHNEPDFSRTLDYYILDMRRRLFWCCYALDRQISMYFGRQFGIDSNHIDCPLLSMRDDLVIIRQKRKDESLRSWLREEPHTKNTTLHFINLRVLQGEIFDYIHDTKNRVSHGRSKDYNDAELQKQMLEHNTWKSARYHDLLAWISETRESPLTTQPFNDMIFRLNYNQTLIQLYGLSNISPVIIDCEHFEITHRAGKEMISIYADLTKQKLINFSWVAINNLYMGATVYLQLIALSESLLKRIDYHEVQNNCQEAMTVLEALCDVCYDLAQEYCRKFKSFSASVLAQLQQKRPGETDAQQMPLTKKRNVSNVFSALAEDGCQPGFPQVSRADQVGELEFDGFHGVDGSLKENDVLLNLMMGSVNGNPGENPETSFKFDAGFFYE